MYRRRPFISIVASIVPILVLLLAMAIPGTAQAAGRTVKFGPFASTSPDSSTCGNDWATDYFDRFFTVDTRQDENGNYTIEERFANGSFETMEGPSPGGCDTNPGGTIPAGITGTMQGNFTIIVYNGSYNASGCDNADCTTTAGFVSAVFGDGATSEVTTYRFEYTAGGPDLSWHTWKNASEDRGGNSGDIAS